MIQWKKSLFFERKEKETKRITLNESLILWVEVYLLEKTTFVFVSFSLKLTSLFIIIGEDVWLWDNWKIKKKQKNGALFFSFCKCPEIFFLQHWLFHFFFDCFWCNNLFQSLFFFFFDLIQLKFINWFISPSFLYYFWNRSKFNQW